MEIYAAGAVAAFTVDVLVYPLDTLKTRYQSQDYLSAYGTSSRKALAPRGLYQGIGSVVLATLPAAGLFFSTYEKAKAVIGNLPLHQSLVHASASATAELASCLVLAPAEVIKQNAQILREDRTKSRTSTSLQAWRQLAAGDAPRRLFTGYTALVARNLPFTALQFPIFEHLRSWAWERRRQRGSQERGVLEMGLVAGASAGGAGAVAAWVTTPSDVVKTRMMLTAARPGCRSGEGGGKNGRVASWTVTRQIYNERGLVGFFRGALFRSGWTALGSSLYLGTYDGAKLWLRRRKSGMDGDDLAAL
ncbi:mitochondrial carrier protein [Metarhizium robertsii]|uniref:Mitochondrial S-adenosylmethionine transporter n=2 Tax=Metarhizium robertsii TaxID=568076 RepID=E9ETN1_METRA|nr:mitochondrial S-adenosylmethionine transporter [Metarhizium robertsii ARSEF 23]EFZ00784.2 mitochondrial S-adenosylmethionine transporter [Metarhizium robertsii ARSEF 23]EXV03304.1 mitochondrial carrier protein [Metarhizium robertsii]